MSKTTCFKTRLRKKGQITVPAPVREILNVSEGDDLIFHIDEQGRVLVERVQIVPPDQAWFWRRRWQQMEQEAQADIEAGRTERFDTVDDMLAWLEDDAED